MSAPAFEPDPQLLPTMGSRGDPASVRPAPIARTSAQMRFSLDAIAELVACGDRRIEALGKGGYFAACWAVGDAAEAPATGIHRPSPNFREIAAEVEAAGRAAAGVQTFPHSSWCDEGRIAARGVEEWLAWAFLPQYPLPMWLVPSVPLPEIRSWVLGPVGRGAPGLLGPGVSQERFPYDVADVLANSGYA